MWSWQGWVLVGARGPGKQVGVQQVRVLVGQCPHNRTQSPSQEASGKAEGVSLWAEQGPSAALPLGMPGVSLVYRHTWVLYSAFILGNEVGEGVNKTHT